VLQIIATWNFPRSLQHVAKVAGVKFLNSGFVLVPKYLNLVPKYFQFWNFDSCSNSSILACNRNSAIFELKQLTII